jgi:hypothetical protein
VQTHRVQVPRCSIANNRVYETLSTNKGAGAPQDQTMVSIERNDEGRSKEGKGDTAELNRSLPLGASKR